LEVAIEFPPFILRFKGALHDLQPHPPTYSKKVEIFIPSETLDYIIFVCIAFLAYLVVSVWQRYSPYWIFVCRQTEIITQ